MDPAVADIVSVCELLDRGRAEEAQRVLRQSRHGGPLVRESLDLAASGLIHENDGDADAARSCFRRVYDHGVPLPVLLRLCGEHFRRAGDRQRAYRCYALLQSFDPRARQAFRPDLSGTELVRYAPWYVRQLLGSRRPRFYPLQPFKAALAQQLGAEASAFTFAQLAGFDLGDVRTLPVTGLRDYAERSALAYDELSPSRRIELPAPPEFGRPRQPPTEATVRTMFVCALTDAIVSSKSNFIVAGDCALLDHEPSDFDIGALNLDVDPIVIAPRAGEVTAMLESGAVGAAELEEAFALVGVHSSNFGHWLIEFLPRLWGFVGRPAVRGIPILIDEQMVPQHREALELFVGDDHPIVELKRGQAVRVRKLWTCSALLYFPLGPKPGESESDVPIPIDADAFARLLVGVEPRLDAIDDRDGPRRIFLSRKDTQHRPLVNRLEVEAWFAERGFDVFDPGDLSFGEQLRRTRSADTIVGPDGSGMWNSFFARPGTGIGYLNNPYLEEHWWIASLAEARGHRLSILTADVVRENPSYRKFSDYRIDLARLPPFLDELSSRG